MSNESLEPLDVQEQMISSHNYSVESFESIESNSLSNSELMIKKLHTSDLADSNLMFLEENEPLPFELKSPNYIPKLDDPNFVKKFNSSGYSAELEIMLSNGTIADFILDGLFNVEASQLDIVGINAFQMKEMESDVIPKYFLKNVLESISTVEAFDHVINLDIDNIKDIDVKDFDLPSKNETDVQDLSSLGILLTLDKETLKDATLNRPLIDTRIENLEFPRIPNMYASSDESIPLTKAVTLDPLLLFIQKITPLKGEELQRALIIHFLCQVEMINVGERILLNRDSLEELSAAVMSAYLDNHAYLVFDALEEALENSRIHVVSTRRNAVALGADLTEEIFRKTRSLLDAWFSSCGTHERTDLALHGSIEQLNVVFTASVEKLIYAYHELLVESLTSDLVESCIEDLTE